MNESEVGLVTLNLLEYANPILRISDMDGTDTDRVDRVDRVDRADGPDGTDTDRVDDPDGTDTDGVDVVGMVVPGIKSVT
jgi:hypothetical protein